VLQSVHVSAVSTPPAVKNVLGLHFEAEVLAAVAILVVVAEVQVMAYPVAVTAASAGFVQSVHSMNGKTENASVLQLVQPAVDAAVEIVPAAQNEHVVAPLDAVLPATHDVAQSVPAAPVFPTAQFSQALKSALLVLPAGQLVQPSSEFVVPPLVDVLPAAQLEHAMAPWAEVVPAAHNVVQSSPALPVFPTAQSLHVVNGDFDV
jgi:hypothetical protein